MTHKIYTKPGDEEIPKDIFFILEQNGETVSVEDDIEKAMEIAMREGYVIRPCKGGKA